MQIKRKHILLALLGVLAFSVYSFASAKVAQAKILLQKLIWKINPPKRIHIADGQLKFSVDLTLSNPTSEDFSFTTGGTIQVIGFRVFYGDKLLAKGNLGNIYQVSLKGLSDYTFKDIQVGIPLTDLSGIVANIVTGGKGVLSLLSAFTQKGGFQQLVNTAKNIDWQQQLKNFTFEVDIQGFGQTYLYRQQLQ